jgi:GTP-binding protein
VPAPVVDEAGPLQFQAVTLDHDAYLGRLVIGRVARAGDLAVIAGVDSIEVGDTLCAPDHLEALPRIAVDPPTAGRASDPTAGSRPVGGRLHGRRADG